MRRSITLAALIGIATGLGAPDSLRAQTTGDVAPVPGPYQAAPVTGTLAYANPARTRALPYWMRAQPAQPGATGATPPVFIPGWVWSPGAPNQRRANPAPVRGAPGQGAYPAPPGAGVWRGQQPPAYGATPYGVAPYGVASWGPPGYAPGNWPNAPYFAPRGYGAPQQRQQPQR